VIVGTAGHIDHGKTTLVRALTGVDTDRLPEEKRRGISIELGYAFIDDAAAGARIGFVDVPGHERLVHTMLAGATGMDAALLLVAADDGVMPQTREHLAVLALLGLRRLAVVVTKVDRADADRRAAVAAALRALLAPTPFADAPVFEVAAAAGIGLGALRAWLSEAALTLPQRHTGAAAFRLAIDRVFTLAGVGTVATGTVHAGAVDVGAELLLLPGPQPGAAPRRLKVRSLHAHNRSAERAEAGERCALNLVAPGGHVEKDDLARGQWLVSPWAASTSTRMDVLLALWHEEARPLRSGTPVTLHLGAASVAASVAVLEPGQDSIAPGACGLVQLVLHAPIGAWAGDRLVLRDASASRTVAGGTVLDPQAPARYRRTAQRLAELAALRRPDVPGRAQALLAASPLGLDLPRFFAAQGEGLPEGWARSGPEATPLRAGDWCLAAPAAEAWREALRTALDRFHAAHPDEPGPDAARLRRLAAPRLPEPLFRAVLRAMQQTGELVVQGAVVQRPEHGVRLSASEERIAQKLAPGIAAAGFEGAWARDLARDSGESEPLVRTTLARLAQRGELHQIVKDLFVDAPTMARLVALVRRVGAEHGGVAKAATFRDATGLGRKRAIQILEHLDRIGVLRRVGDEHRLRSDSTLLAEESAADATRIEP
jgi:selenocysteine-specific elongation factor